MTSTRSGCQNKIVTLAVSSTASKRVNKVHILTKAEMHTNSYSCMHAMIYARYTVSWIRVFHGVDRDNREKISCPYSYTNNMIVWVLLIMNLNNLNWRVATGDVCGYNKDLWRHGVLYKYRLQDMPFPDYTTVHRFAKKIFINILVPENSRDDRVVSSYVLSSVKR